MFNLLRSSQVRFPGAQKGISTEHFPQGISDETLSKIYQVIRYNQASKKEQNKVHGGGGPSGRPIYGDLVLKLRNGTSHTIKGRRDPAERFKLYGYNFANKRYIEFGSNCGHNLMHVQHGLKWGVGFDYNSGYVNVANFVKENMGYRHISFYVLDLMTRKPSEALAYLPENTVDVSVVFAVNQYLSNEVWGSLLDFLFRITKDVMLIEINGPGRVTDYKHYQMLRSKCGVGRFEDVTNNYSGRPRRLTICRLQKKQ